MTDANKETADELAARWKAEASRNERRDRRVKIVVFVVVVVGFLTFGMLRGMGFFKTKHEKCVERGIDYYQDVGMYPTLDSGGDTTKHVEGMCSRSSNQAFQ